MEEYLDISVKKLDFNIRSSLQSTNCRMSRLFFFGFTEGEIEKMRSIFFQNRKSSGVATEMPAGSEANVQITCFSGKEENPAS